MRILQLCKKFPYPPKDGESIAVTYLSKALVEDGCDMTLLSFNTSKHYINTKELSGTFNHYKEVHTVSIDNELKRWDAIKNLFSSKSFHISRFESERFSNKLIEILQENEYDVILLETLFLASYMETIRQHSKALVVMRAHNVEHEIWERLETNMQFLPKKMYVKYLTGKLKRYEIEMLNKYDFLVPISECDLSKFRKLGYMNGAHAVPIGLDMKAYKPKAFVSGKKLSMGFIGSLDWLPNLEGITWFLKNIWPQMHARFPDLELHVAGRKAPDSLINLKADKVFIHGEVEDARAFMNEHEILLVPLLSGSGMRAKILEGMALGRVVLSTTLGLEGITAPFGKTVLAADNAKEFIDAIQKLKDNPKDCMEIASSARDFVEHRFDHKLLAEDLKQAIVEYRAANPKNSNSTS